MPRNPEQHRQVHSGFTLQADVLSDKSEIARTVRTRFYITNPLVWINISC